MKPLRNFRRIPRRELIMGLILVGFIIVTITVVLTNLTTR